MGTAVRLSMLASWLFVVTLALAEECPLDVVPDVDFERYSGVWYEVARLPNRFQEQCVGEVSATYRLRGDGRFSVVNACRRVDGKFDQAEGVARLASPGESRSKLEVRFAPAWLAWLPMVWGDYWVIELAPDYSYSVVGTPSRTYLWILAREPQMPRRTIEAILQRAGQQGFDTTRMIMSGRTVGVSPAKPAH